jgi:hypothetical protein
VSNTHAPSERARDARASVGLGGLAVDDCRRGAGRRARAFARRQVVWQQPPRAARPDDIEDAVDEQLCPTRSLPASLAVTPCSCGRRARFYNCAGDLKGITGPVRASAALRASSAEGRFEAMHETGLTALVGRAQELNLLLRLWSRAKTGEGQVVLLSGEAGIGKSRLTAALLERLPRSRTRACGISVHPNTLTARFTRSLAKWSAPPGSRTTTLRKRSSINSTRYWPRVLPHPRTPRCLPKCCRYRTMDAIPPSNWPRSSAGRKRSKL